MAEDAARIDHKHGGGYLLTYGPGIAGTERVPIDVREDIICLGEALGHGPQIAPLMDHEAEAYARDRIDEAIYAGETVARSHLENVA